jgi:hypothetical protein
MNKRRKKTECKHTHISKKKRKSPKFEAHLRAKEICTHARTHARMHSNKEEKKEKRNMNVFPVLINHKKERDIWLENNFLYTSKTPPMLNVYIYLYIYNSHTE